MQNDNILKDAIAEAKTLRKLSMSNARHSLVKFLKEEKLPLDDLADAELDLDHFVDLIMKRSRERDEEDDNRGLPYLNSKHKLRKTDNEDELEERSQYSDDDEFEIDYGDGNVEKSGKKNDDEESDFADDVLDERIRKNQSHLSRTQLNSSPAFITSGVGSVKLTDRERQILTKNLKLNELKRSSHPKINKQNDDRDLLKKRSGIKENTGKAKQLISDLNNKNNILKG
jgi:hypothetical protein